MIYINDYRNIEIKTDYILDYDAMVGKYITVFISAGKNNSFYGIMTKNRANHITLINFKTKIIITKQCITAINL